jgi:hypothetical protein
MPIKTTLKVKYVHASIRRPNIALHDRMALQQSVFGERAEAERMTDLRNKVNRQLEQITISFQRRYLQCNSEIRFLHTSIHSPSRQLQGVQIRMK